jgi:[ribosomal protein S5]-alanine N-acetyltransferase
VSPTNIRRNEVWTLQVFETERLIVRWLDVSDKDFILRLLNEPGWLKYIGDKGVRSLEDAENYILSGPRSMYERLGFGLFVAEIKETRLPIGLCGLIKRDGLEDVDLGFAFLEAHQSKGYAYEAAKGTMEYARKFGLNRIVAITTKANASSSKLLEKLGMLLEGYVTLPNDTEEMKLYGIDLED